MAGKPKYVELVLAVTPSLLRHTLAGYELVSDYTSGGQRHLFLKRAEAAAQPKARTRKAATATVPEPAVANG